MSDDEHNAANFAYIRDEILGMCTEFDKNGNVINFPTKYWVAYATRYASDWVIEHGGGE